MEEEESHFYRRQVGRKNGVKVSGKLYQERKSGGKESENLSVKSLPRLTHAHIHVNTSSCTHTPLQTRRHTHTRTLLFNAFTTCGVCPALLAALPRAFECRLECIPLFQTAP